MKHNDKMLSYARELRKNQTKEEKKLWYEFLCTSPNGAKFRRQQIIEGYIVDFYCPTKKLVIELDGSQHYTEEGEISDANRDKVLSDMGIKVVRFTNLDINQRFIHCCEEIFKILESS